MNKKSLCLLILLTPLIFWLTHVFAFFIHEYCHSFSAWIFGVKHNPLELYYGDTSWLNIFSLYQVHENVDYPHFAPQHPWIAAFTAFAGFGIGNVVLLLVCLRALQTKKQHSVLYYYFFLWLAVMNLGNFIDYVPSRVFGTHGDMQVIVSSLKVSPWCLMIVLGYPICFSFWYFYSKVLPACYAKMNLSIPLQAALLMMFSFVLFAIFGTAGLHGYGSESDLISMLSFYITPIAILACWPERSWVRKASDNNGINRNQTP